LKHQRHAQFILALDYKAIMSNDQSWFNYLGTSYKIALDSFCFLESAGFQLAEKQEATGNNARYDGWHFEWNGPINIRIEYYEMEFNVIFSSHGSRTSYLFVDYEIFNNRSGLQGTMFSSDKLQHALEKTGKDIKDNYGDILKGDPFIWKKISKKVEEAQQKNKKEGLEKDKKEMYRFERIDAKEAFQKKKYKKVIKLLKDAEEYLEPLEKSKLEYSRKKVKEKPWWRLT
jgi:hypothetical protein